VGGAVSPPPHWLERARTVSRVSSYVIDPPDGRIPALTPAAQAAAQQRQQAQAARRKQLNGIEADWSAGGRESARLDWYMAMACFKLGVVIEGTWSRYLMGKASRDAGEALHFNAQNLIDIGTRVVKGDNPFELT